MSSIEYTEIQRSTPVRASITRSLFNMALTPFHVIFLILPKAHPARIFMRGRVPQLSQGMNETLACRGYVAISVIVALILVTLLCGAEAAFDAADINPIGRAFGL